ncbi:MAG: hypothetical protein HYY84_13950 [Deltaproteobacteria bacterium]|nr:hypothetical protein [Deltaproteobacteria bacterium]
MHVFICSAGFEPALVALLGGGKAWGPGVVAVGDAHVVAATDPMFARQILPDATAVFGASIRELAERALEIVLSRLEQCPGPWRLDVFAPDSPVDANLHGETDRRASLVRDRFVVELKARRRAVGRRRTEDAGAMRVQLLLMDRDRLIVSLATPVALACGALWPSPFVGGRPAIGDDWDAPSSAFRKLEEALRWMGTDIALGARVVDLGAAPGGWSHVALKRGASVVAVDRADLDPRVGTHPRLTHVRRTAFSFEPDDPPVDWLLCDVIAAPEKSRGLLDRWLSKDWCRHFAFHLKFKGRGDYRLAEGAVKSARDSGFVVRAKHLFHDKNEVTLWGRRAPREMAPPTLR